MKTIIKILAVVAVVMAVTACNGKDKPNGRLEQGAMLYINVKNGNLKSMDVRATDDREGLLTPREIVEQAGMFMFTHPDGKKDSNISIAPSQKDVENERIKMWGEQVIHADGTLNDYFITLRDVRLVAPFPKDENGNYIYTDKDNVVGYIPNEVMERAEREIRKEYAAGNYDKVYKLFQDAYTATPINLEMWEALQKEGKQ